MIPTQKSRQKKRSNQKLNQKQLIEIVWIPLIMISSDKAHLLKKELEDNRGFEPHTQNHNFCRR
jgi:hypothetical protein